MYIYIYIMRNLLYIASRQFRPGGRPHGTRVTWRRHYIHKYTCMQHFTVTTTRAPGVYIYVCVMRISTIHVIYAHTHRARAAVLAVASTLAQSAGEILHWPPNIDNRAGKYIYTSVVNFALAAGRTADRTRNLAAPLYIRIHERSTSL